MAPKPRQKLYTSAHWYTLTPPRRYTIDLAFTHIVRGRLLEVCDALLVPVEAVEELAVFRTDEIRPDPPRHVAAIGRVLDLDDLGTEIGQLHRSVRPRAILLERNH